jgi:uncharacterized protein YjdB
LAFDISGGLIFEGSKTIDVTLGRNAPLSLALISKAGQVPIVVTVGSVSLTIQPTEATIAVDGTVPLAATITAPNGDILPGPVEWATTDPSKVAVNSTGLVRGIAVGSAQIVATYAGVAATSTITVQ